MFQMRMVVTIIPLIFAPESLKKKAMMVQLCCPVYTMHCMKQQVS